MLQVKNSTPFATTLSVLPDVAGIDTVYAVVKGTFAIGPRLVPADEQVPVTMADQHYADPSTSSIRAPSDVCLGKPGTDVVLIGSAWSPDGRPTWQMDVSLTVGALSKTVRVLGDRIWESSASGTSMAWVAPFVRMPLVWERAFGGSDQTEKGPRAHARNPVGTGLRVSGGTRPLLGMPLPNVEDPRALISGPGDSPEPAGFAPIAPHWDPRKNFAGTYDDTWQRSRAPYLPSDFDSRFFHYAPAGQLTTTPLVGGEPVVVVGATPDGTLRFEIPRVAVQATFKRNGGEETRRAALESVLIEPDANRVLLVWRAALNCDKQVLKMKQVDVSLLPG
jgi:hypothetical protein